jgi:signal transduction histidine kinase
MRAARGRRSRKQESHGSSHDSVAVDSRALAAESGERRQIGHDLHDGTQQRLVVLLVGLSTLVDLIDSDPAQAVGLTKRLENEAQEAIDELRALVQGLQPPVLTDLGLVQALHDLSRSLPVKVSMITQGVQRYDSAVEDAVFFTCREALQNTMKHARSASIVWVMVIDDGDRLEFSVEDNGPGFDAALPGTGSATMHHRVEALGGSLTINSSPGVGTRVEGRIPIH